MFKLQIYCLAPWYLPLVLCWWFRSIRGVLVNFFSVWMKRRKLSVKKPLWLCIWGAARGSKPVFVWIKMKGFRSRLVKKSALRCSRGGWWERRVEEKNWRFQKLRLSDFCIKKRYNWKSSRRENKKYAKIKGSFSTLSSCLRHSLTETNLSDWWQSCTGQTPCQCQVSDKTQSAAQNNSLDVRTPNTIRFSAHFHIW